MPRTTRSNPRTRGRSRSLPPADLTIERLVSVPAGPRIGFRFDGTSVALEALDLRAATA